MSMTYLIPSTFTKYRALVKEANGLLAVAKTIPDEVIRESVMDKINASSKAYRDQYAEYSNSDGSIVVKHPGIGFITVDEEVLEEPERLFASRVKSMSIMRICLYQADALVDGNGSVSYINKRIILEVEMTQAAFSGLVAHGSGERFPSTIRNKNGDAVIFEGDISSIRNQMIMSDTLDMTKRLDERVKKLLDTVKTHAESGKAMSAKARDAVAFDAGIVKDWTDSNPGYYAKRLGQYTAETTADIKMEVDALFKIQGVK